MLRTFIKPMVFVLLFSLGLVGLGLVSAEQPPIKTYTVNQGLVHDRIFKIVRDSHGFLWFGTNDGLSRFDGQHFVNYDIADGLIHNRIEDIVESRDGTYWIGTLGGLSSFVPSRDSLPFLRSNSNQPLFTNHVIHGDKNANVIASLLEDRAGQLWVGTQAGLFRLNRTATDPAKRFEAISVGFPNKPDNLFEVVLMAEDHEGSLWLGSIFGLSRRLPDGRFVHYSVRPSEGADSIRAIAEDREGRLWIGHQSGLMIYKPEPASVVKPGFIALETIVQQNGSSNSQNGKLMMPTKPGEARWYTTADGLADQRVRAVCETSDGHVWVGTVAGGVSEFDGQQFRNLTTDHGISRLVTDLAEDSAGNLWVGARIGGVTKIARSGFMNYRQVDGLGSTDVFSIFADRNNRVIVFNNDWTINQFEGSRFTSAKLNLPEKVKGTSTGNRPTIQAHDGEWWVATGEGLFRFPAVESIEKLATVKPKAAYFESDGLASNNITRMMEDSRGDLWISSYTPPVTLTRWERATGKFYRYGENDGIPENNWAHVMAEDRAGNVWMGLHYGELMRVQNGKIEVFHHSDGVPQGLMTGIFCDSAGRMWVGSEGGGLLRINDPAAGKPELKVYRTSDGLSSNNISCFTEDRWGRIYIGTSRGVDRLDLSNDQVKQFTAGDGLGGGEIVAAFADREGTLWFGSREGLSRLRPEQTDSQTEPPDVFIGKVSAGGQPQSVPELGLREVRGLEFEPGQGQLQIEFFGFSFDTGSGLRYQYKFEGADRDWSAPGNQRTVTASLSPGSYRFLVRAVSASGKFSSNPAVVSFRILPPFYRRWWFLSLIAAALAALGVYAYRQRVRRLLEIERVRTRIATDLHDDIGASLSRVAILSEVVQQQGRQSGHLNEHNLRSAQMLTEIADSARGLVDSMSDIVWSIDPRRDDLGQVITRTRQFAADVLDSQGINWQFIAAAEIEKVKLDPEQRRHLFLIFKEALNNIARHAAAKNVLMNLSISGTQLLAEISDDGLGFTPQVGETAVAVLPKSRGGNGLGNMQARAAELKGKLTIGSAPGKGTRLILSLPLKR